MIFRFDIKNQNKQRLRKNQITKQVPMALSLWSRGRKRPNMNIYQRNININLITISNRYQVRMWWSRAACCWVRRTRWSRNLVPSVVISPLIWDATLSMEVILSTLLMLRLLFGSRLKNWLIGTILCMLPHTNKFNRCMFCCVWINIYLQICVVVLD